MREDIVSDAARSYDAYIDSRESKGLALFSTFEAGFNAGRVVGAKEAMQSIVDGLSGAPEFDDGYMYAGDYDDLDDLDG